MNDKKLYTAEEAKKLAAQVTKLVVKELGMSEENGTFKVIASDETVDRHGETILVSAWRTANFMNNPVILFGHNYREIDNIVGRATRIYTEDSKLIIEGVFAPEDANPKAQQVRKLYEGGFLNTVSVGLIPLARDPKNWDIIIEAELLEVSFVPVPANPNALNAKGLDTKELLESGVVVEEGKESENKEDDIEKDPTLKEIFAIVSDIKGIVIGVQKDISAINKSVTDGNVTDVKAFKPMLQAVDKAVGAVLAKMK